MLGARIGSALRRSGRLVARRPRLGLWATAGVTAAAIALGAAILVANNVERWATAWPGGSTLVVYLDPEITPDRGQSIAGGLGTIAGVVRADYVPTDEAGRRLRAALGGGEALLAGVEPGALPASIELVLEPGARDVVTASPLFATLRSSDVIDDVELVGAWDDKIGALLGGLRTGAWAVAALFAALAMIGMAVALRLRFAAAPDHSAQHARVARLLGAGPGYFAGPAIVAGAVHGAIAAALALPILYYLHHELAPAVGAALTSTIGGGDLAFLPVTGIAVVVLAGMALGAVGGALGTPHERA